MSAVRPSSLPVQLVSHTRPIKPPHDLLQSLGAGGFAWLHEGAGIVTAGVAARIAVGPGSARIERAAAEVAAFLGGIEVDDPLRVPGTGPLAVGALPFASDAVGELIVPAMIVGSTDDGRAWITEVEPAAEPPLHLAAPFTAEPPSRFVVDAGDGKPAWAKAVNDAVATIASGPLAKVVLAREVVVEANRPFDAKDCAAHLAHADPTCFVYVSGDFVGASPELLVRRRGRRVVSRPMAGSALRGATVADDDLLVSRLESSPKELGEHRMVVEAVCQALEASCDHVVAGARPDVVRLATVTHLATTVVGELGTKAPSALELAGLLHPTPAVAGLPTDHALETIGRLESFDRGLYAGPVGWVDSRGDGEWAIALRCAQLEGTTARLAAGAGIVAGSDVDAEWDETQAKMEPMLRSLVRP